MPLSDEPKDPYEAPATLSVEATTPANGQSGVSLTDNLSVTFNQGVGRTGVPTSSTSACEAGVQVSSDGFTTCEPAQLTPSKDLLTYTLDPDLPLSSKTEYQLRATTDISALGGAKLASNSDVGFTTEALCDSGCDWDNLTVNGLTARSNHAGAVFDGKMYVMGGIDASRLNSVQHSTDGITWTNDTVSVGWTARSGMAAVVFDGKLWVIGGDNGSLLNDVWAYDGTLWEEIRSNGDPSGFTPRSGHAALAFNQKLWVMGGTDRSSSYLYDVWTSEDGINWTSEPISPPSIWTARADHTATVFEGQMWVMGGTGTSGKLNDVWHSSTDGTSWTSVSTSSIWPARTGHHAAVFEQALWVVEGDNGSTGDHNGIVNFWTSPEGTTWTTGSSSTWDKPVANGVLLRYNNALYLVGEDGSSSSVVLRYGK